MAIVPQGFNNGGTFGDDASEGGTVVWANQSNAQTNNSVYASASFGMADVNSDYLTATNFGFNIPSGATITGIYMEFNGYYDTAGAVVQGLSVKLIKGGVLSGSNRDSITDWPTSDDDTYRTYGSATDLWGNTLTPSDVNATNFGVGVSCQTGAGPATAFIDHIQMVVHYEPASTDPSGQPPQIQISNPSEIDMYYQPTT